MRWFYPLPLALAFALSACASGGVDLLPRSSQPSAGTALSRARARVIARIVVPRKRLNSSRSHYVSPATQSIAITVTSSNGRAQQFNADLNPSTNRNCTAAFVCTISFALAPGRYRAAFATYDGPLAGGNGFTNPPTGNELSANGDVPLHLKAGHNALLRIVLGGIPARAEVVSYGDDGFTFPKCASTDSVGVFGFDADDNVIVGPGAPTVALASSDTAHLAVLHTPSPASPNTFVLSRAHLPLPGTPVILTATVTPTAGSGAGATARAKATFNADVCGTFTHYSIPTTNSLPYLGIIAGHDGAVWFAEYRGDKIGRITTTGSFTEYAAGAGGSEPDDLASDSSGLMWFTAHGSNAIGSITTGGTVTHYDISIVGASGLFGIAIGSDGGTWWVAENSNQVGELTVTGATYSISSEGTPTAGANPVGVTAGPDGNIWFTEITTDKIGQTIPTGLFPTTEFDVPAYGGEPYAITAGPDGALWFTEFGGNNIGRITTAGSISEFAIPTPVSNPYGIAAGPDGALWFAENAANKIGRITTSGSITEFPITGTTDSQPIGITTGPDGNVWFTESGSNQIGRLQ